MIPEQWNMGEGFERLNGHKALKYARYRGTPGADLDRIDHQQKLLAALRRQALLGTPSLDYQRSSRSRTRTSTQTLGFCR